MTSPSRETPRTVRRDHSGTGCRGQAGAKTPVPGRGSLTPNPGARSGDRRPGRTKEAITDMTHPATRGRILPRRLLLSPDERTILLGFRHGDRRAERLDVRGNGYHGHGLLTLRAMLDRVRAERLFVLAAWLGRF